MGHATRGMKEQQLWTTVRPAPPGRGGLKSAAWKSLTLGHRSAVEDTSETALKTRQDIEGESNGGCEQNLGEEPAQGKV